MDDWQLVENFNSITLSPTAGRSTIQIRISQDSPEHFLKEINIYLYFFLFFIFTSFILHLGVLVLLIRYNIKLQKNQIIRKCFLVKFSFFQSRK